MEVLSTYVTVVRIDETSWVCFWAEGDLQKVQISRGTFLHSPQKISCVHTCCCRQVGRSRRRSEGWVPEEVRRGESRVRQGHGQVQGSTELMLLDTGLFQLNMTRRIFDWHYFDNFENICKQRCNSIWTLIKPAPLCLKIVLLSFLGIDLGNSRLKDAPFSKGEMEVQDSNSQLCVGPSQNGSSRFKFTMTEFRPATSECPSSITSRTEAGNFWFPTALE